MATVTNLSDNPKLGGTAATYASEITCPPDCPMLKICYAKKGPLSWVWKRITRLGGKTALADIRDEARKLLTLPKGRRVRLHVAGDVRTDFQASILAKAARRLRPWTYTHSWKDVKRSSWGSVSVLASCETTAGVREANARGYAAALVVEEFPREKAFERDGLKIVPCPEQTGRAASCADCQLCFDDSRLRRTGVTIGFKGHGPRNHDAFVKRHIASLQ